MVSATQVYQCNHILVGGLEHESYFSIQLGMSSSQLTFIFFRWVETTNQALLVGYEMRVVLLTSVEDVHSGRDTYDQPVFHGME